jgi:hypothetical protein
MESNFHTYKREAHPLILVNSRQRKIFKENSSGWPKISKGHTQLRSMGAEKQEQWY